jgi:thioredoxin-related protein
MTRLLALLLALAIAAPSRAQAPSPHAIDIPHWFTETVLEFRDDVREASAQGKRLMLYFGQDGCPYCTALMQNNFSQRSIADKTQRHFVAIALNLWGDREVVWADGRRMSEKALGRELRVQFTPTLLFLDEQGAVALRLNGYLPPHRFEAALDYAAGLAGKGVRYDEYTKTAIKEAASATLRDEAFFAAPPVALMGADPVARAACRLHPDNRNLRSRQGSVPHRLLPAAFPSCLGARLCREPRLPQGALLPALPAGARRAAARTRRKGGPVELILSTVLPVFGLVLWSVLGDVNTSPPPANPPPGRTRRNCASPRLLLAPVRCQR